MATPLLDYVEKVTAAESVEEVWALLTERMAEFGFDRLIYGFTRFRTANSFGDLQDCLVLSNHDRRYVDRFIGERMYFDAPMVRWAAEHVGACSWGWLEANRHLLTPRQRAILDFNRSMGVTAGYSIAFSDATVREKGAIALTALRGTSQAEVDALWKRAGRSILAMNNLAHLKITALPYTVPRQPLTRRQREALEWVSDGKTMQDIAAIMGLTPATVEKHLRLAREALDVQTTAQAVLKASMQNQIFTLQM